MQLPTCLATEDALTEIALSSLVRELDRVGPVRLHSNDGNVLPGNHASETQAGLEIFEFRHGQSVVGRTAFGLTGLSRREAGACAAGGRLRTLPASHLVAEAVGRFAARAARSGPKRPSRWSMTSSCRAWPKASR
jgi:hypothetical protein